MGKTPIQVSNLTQTEKRRQGGDLVVKKQWVPPSSGWVKLNVDGPFHVEAKDGGVGMVLRDDRGAIIFTACRFLGACSSMLEVELLACLEGCRLAR
jgi:hypothetical protein